MYKNITSSFKAHGINTANTTTTQACHITKKNGLGSFELAKYLLSTTQKEETETPNI